MLSRLGKSSFASPSRSKLICSGTKYPQSFNPPAYLLRQLEAYIATLPGIVAGDSRFKAAAADLDKTLASLFINTMNGASHIQVVNSLLQAGLNSQILTGTVFKQSE